jgi:mono/diheme cytochrome c family protein
MLLFASILGTVVVLAQDGGSAETSVDQDLFEQGQQLYRSNCVICHQQNGEGNPPTFPPLAGNENLQDLELIVTNIHDGRNVMPAFPQFDATQVAALATYVRNAWENEFGGAEVSVVKDLLAQDGDEESSVSIWNGVYTMAQAERGEPLYTRCSDCHGIRRLGQGEPELPDFFFASEEPKNDRIHLRVTDPGQITGPPLGGRVFFRKWAGNTLGTLYLVSSTTMPQDNPGSLPDQDYIDIIAFLLASNDVPPGDEELRPDVSVLNNIVIEPPPEE